MTEYKAIRAKERCPSHPGAALNDILDDIKIVKSDLAKLLGISRQQLYDILGEQRALSPQIAVRVAKAFGGSPESWLRMQAAYDAWHAMREVDTSKIPVLSVA